MVSQEIITEFRSELAEGLDIRSVGNILLKKGFSIEEVNEAVDFIEKERRAKALNASQGNYETQESKAEQQTFMMYYVIAIAIIVLAGALAMYMFGLF